MEREVQRGDRASGTFEVLLQARGVAQVVRRGRRAELGPGDAVLIDGAQAFRLEMAPGYRQVVFELPRGWIGRRSSSLFGRAGDALSAGIFRRRLDAIFAAHGQSAERLIWERRIERAAEELASPAQARRSLIDIALGWGFSSPSQFSRSFRRRFGASPSEFRARAVRES